MSARSVFKLLLLVIICWVSSDRAKAQSVIGYSDVVFVNETNTVTGFSVSELDYIGSFNYQAYLEGYLYNQSGQFLDADSNISYFLAAAFTTAPGQPFTEYTLFSDHYLIARYYTTVETYPCDPPPDWWNYWDSFEMQSSGSYACYNNQWWDPFGYGFSNGGYYGSWYEFVGGPPANLETEYIYVGSTSDSLVTPPDSCRTSTVQDNQ